MGIQKRRARITCPHSDGRIIVDLRITLKNKTRDEMDREKDEVVEKLMRAIADGHGWLHKMKVR